MTTNDEVYLQYESLKLVEKQFNSIEKQVISYIYNKYIYTKDLENTKDTDGNIINTKTPISLKELQHKLLKPDKPRIYTDEQIMKREIKDIQYASDLYEDAPEDYKNGLTEYGYPDSLRCNFIIWRKNSFHRCQKRIKETDDNYEYCCLHLDQENEYEEEYREIYAKLRKQIIKNNELNDDIY
jgi:hypothetical protein